jgi:hypothetical protein
MLAVNATGLLRISEEGETYGLDLHEHGISAYPEYMITPFGSPTGLSMQTTSASQASSSFAAKPLARGSNAD